MTPVDVAVQGIAYWSPTLPGWTHARTWLRGEGRPLAEPAPLPSPAILGVAERRRAPESARIALHVAAQAVEAAGVDARALRSVFASAHGDLAITHDTCTTLARAPHELSPIRFMNSVHNAVAGHWGAATGSTRASTAVAAGPASFAMGLFEAAAQVVTVDEPVLLVGYETEPVGLTGALTGARTGNVGPCAVAMLLGPRRAREGYVAAWLRMRWVQAGAAPVSTSRDVDPTVFAAWQPLLAALAQVDLPARASIRAVIHPLELFVQGTMFS